MKRFDHLNNLLAQIKSEMAAQEPAHTMEMPVIRALPGRPEVPETPLRERIFDEHATGLDG